MINQSNRKLNRVIMARFMAFWNQKKIVSVFCNKITCFA
jgi:hypothetical protein